MAFELQGEDLDIPHLLFAVDLPGAVRVVHQLDFPDVDVAPFIKDLEQVETDTVLPGFGKRVVLPGPGPLLPDGARPGKVEDLPDPLVLAAGLRVVRDAVRVGLAVAVGSGAAGRCTPRCTPTGTG